MAVVNQVRRPTGYSFWRDEFVRGILLQILTAVVLLALTVFFVHNTAVNLEKRGIASGFDFLNSLAGFDISIQLIPYSISSSSNARAFLVSIVNTLVVSAVGIVLATIIGFVMGVARLSRNYLIRKLAAVYVDFIRNIPLLAQVIFWYFGVLTTLPSVRQSISFYDVFFLNTRGVFMPAPMLQPGFWTVPLAFIIGIAATIAIGVWARRRQVETGEQFPIFWTGLGLVIGLPVLVALVGGLHIIWSMPELKGFNFQGGMVVLPEFLALLLALSIYTGAFIAEIVRAGIQAVSHGQTEAASALGLKSSHTLRLVIIPQALRVIVPPLTSQYLNLAKNSSLGVIIGYPDVVSVFFGTVLNQTGQAVEVVFITMVFYLIISLTISVFMNWYNRRIAMVER